MNINECGFDDEEINKIKDLFKMSNAQKVRVMDKVKIGDFPCVNTTFPEIDAS